jgi:hypothetical protein|tara:strand:+ start:892 stop:1209 length:318 start_codon:yes stop_codon:yes gene_type:complete
VFKIHKNNKYIDMDLLFLLVIGKRVNLKVSNRLKLVRDFEFLIDYEEDDYIYNNIRLNKNDDTLYNQFVKMVERRVNTCKNIKDKLKVDNLNNFLNNWCETNYYI